MTFLRRVRNLKAIASAGYNLLSLAIDPQSTRNALVVSDRLLELGLFKFSVEHLKSNPQTAEALERPLSMSEFDLDRFLNFPKDSLGYKFAATMTAHNLNPNFFRRNHPPAEGNVVLDHIEQTHDLWHIVLGFDTSEAGEVGILAFQFGQLRSPQAVAFIGGALLRCLVRDLSQVPPIMESIVRGWTLAQEWPPLFAVDWNGIMHLPVEHIRSQLDNGIVPSS